MLLFLGLFCAAVPCWASTPTVNSTWLGPGTSAVADLNGDHIPDRATGIETGHSELGFSFRMDVVLSGTSGTKSFTVLSYEPIGINVEALDVDGDRDLDLVISSHLLHRPVGVWLNDGTGFFSPGEPAKYASSLWREKPALTTSSDPRPQVVNSERETSVCPQRLEPMVVRSTDPDFKQVRSFEPHSPCSQLIWLRAPPSSLF